MLGVNGTDSLGAREQTRESRTPRRVDAKYRHSKCSGRETRDRVLKIGETDYSRGVKVVLLRLQVSSPASVFADKMRETLCETTGVKIRHSSPIRSSMFLTRKFRSTKQANRRAVVGKDK